jgi:hypothetical protein
VDGSKFCGSCGVKLGGEAAPTSTGGPAPVPARNPNTVLWAAVVVLAVLLVSAGTWVRKQQEERRAQAQQAQVATPGPAPTADTGTDADTTTDTGATQDAVDESEPEPEPAPEPESKPAPAPVPAEDPVAEATVVLENYLAADLGHDGNEMAKYLGGQAAARFRPEVQGQEDVTIHSKKASGHTVKDANTIVFRVRVRWSPGDGGDTQTSTDRYTVRRTTQGWLITSTPAYP